MVEELDVELSFEDLTFGDEDKKEGSLKDLESVDSDNVVLIASPYGSKVPLPWTTVLKTVEQLCGPVKTENFREKQSFGFVQFFTHEPVEKAVEKIQDIEIEGSKVTAEVCDKITPGRDPRTHDFNSEFKNSTLVLKNLPFQLKQEKLEEILNTLEWKPANVSYLYDGSGMFRGMAFVKYKEIEHATKVFESVNDMDINGRKLRIEYKRKVLEAETPQEDDNKKMYEQLASFGSNPTLTELAFPCASSLQRKQIHHLAEKFGLGHYSTGEGENRFVVVKKKEEKGQPINNTKNRSGSVSKQKNSYEPKSEEDNGNNTRFGSYDKGSRPRSFTSGSGYNIKSPPSSFGSNHVKSPPSSFGNNFIKSPPSSYGANGFMKSPSGNSYLKSPSSSLGTSPTFRKMAHRPPNDGPIVSPSRQPKGPDGTNGFPTEYRELRIKKPADTV